MNPDLPVCCLGIGDPRINDSGRKCLAPFWLAAAFFLSAAYASAQSFVQANAAAAAQSASSFSVSFSSNTLPTDVILVSVDLTAGITTSSVTDSQGNTFTQVGSQLTSPASVSSVVYYAKNIKGGQDTITVSLGSASSLIEVYVAEYAGIDQVNPVDVQAGATGSSATVSSGSATTNYQGDIVYGFCQGDGSCSAGSGFTLRSSFSGNLLEDMTVGAPGPYAATGSANSGWAMHMVALKPATTTSTSSNACDVNKDGTANVLDVQVAADNYVSCPSSSFQTFYSQVITGVLSSCPVSSGLHTVSLSWTASTTSGVSYNVYRATTSGGYNYSAPLNSSPIAGTSFSDCTVTLGQTYFYVVRAVDGSGNQSGNSSEITAAVPSS